MSQVVSCTRRATQWPRLHSSEKCLAFGTLPRHTHTKTLHDLVHGNICLDPRLCFSCILVYGDGLHGMFAAFPSIREAAFGLHSTERAQKGAKEQQGAQRGELRWKTRPFPNTQEKLSF